MSRENYWGRRWMSRWADRSWRSGCGRDRTTNVFKRPITVPECCTEADLLPQSYSQPQNPLRPSQSCMTA